MSVDWKNFLNLAAFDPDPFKELAGLSYVTHLSSLGLLHISGQDAKTFLQGQLTCNVNQINLQQSSLGAHCNLKGRMQSLFRLSMWTSNTYLLTLPLSMVQLTEQNLKKYSLFSQVTLEDYSQQLVKIGIGDNRDILKNTLPELPALANGTYQGLLKDQPYLIIRLPGADIRYELYAPLIAAQTLWEKLHPHCQVVSPRLWELMDIRAGLPTVYPATRDLILPHHANLPALGGVAFDKGCYLGQEVISRMQYKAKIKKHLYHAQLEGALPQVGDQLYTDSLESKGLVVRVSPAGQGSELLVILEEDSKDIYIKEEASLRRLSAW